MPQLSDTMKSGKILAWHKKEGDSISRGDVLAEVETEKANLEIESFHQGTLLKILVPAETAATVGDIIAVIGKPGEDISSIGSAPQQTSNGSHAPQSSTATEAPALAQPKPAVSASGRVKASPLAKRIAAKENIDLSSIQGSGPDGRIVRKDVELAISEIHEPQSFKSPVKPSISRQIPPQRPASTTQGGGTLEPLSKMRETIARRMQESVTEAPHFYVTTTINMREALKLREILKETEEFKGISVNHFIIKGVAYALLREPRVNRAMRNGQLYTPEGINIGIITAVEDGLLIPVVKDADQLSMKEVVAESKAAIDRARAGRPSSTDLVGGTFSISNMGMFDVENFTAIINPGQGGVLAVSSVRETPIVENGHITVGKIMKVTLSVDHRVIDGVMGATFLQYLKEGLETPALLFV